MVRRLGKAGETEGTGVKRFPEVSPFPTEVHVPWTLSSDPTWLSRSRSRCNLRYPHCTKNVFSDQRIDGDMDMATFRAISRAFPYLNQFYIDAWGEPLLHPKV